MLLTGCGRTDREISIAVAGPMTGPDAQMGADFRNGVAIALEEWNGRGGVLGMKIKSVLADDQSDAGRAAVVAKRLVQDRVVGVIGHYNSSCSIPASDVYHQARVPMITPASTNPRLTARGYPGVFRVCGTDDQQGAIGAEFAISKLRAKRIAILHDRTTYGQGLAELFRARLDDSVVIVLFEGIPRGEKDFRGVLRKIQGKKPDLIYFGGVYSEAGLLIKQAHELRLSVPFLSGDAAIDRKLVEIAGKDAAEGTYLTFSPNPENLPAAQSFIEKYRAKHGELGTYSVYAYIAANILLEAIQAAGETDGRAVAEKLHRMEFATVLGPVKFNSQGNVVRSPYVVWITHNGRFQEYWKSKP